MVARGLERFLREEVALESELAVAGDERHRVGQREDDQVVRVARALEERASVVDLHVDPRVVVRVIGVPLLADLVDPRIDLDGVDVLRALRQREGDVGARTGPDDEHVPERVVADALVRKEVVRVDLDALRDGHHSLMGNAVHVDAREVAVDPRRDLVVRRPGDAGREALEEQHDDQRDRSAANEHGRLRSEQHEREDGHDGTPRDRRRAKEREHGERRDAEQAADQVPPIGLEPRKLVEARGDELARARKDHRDRAEDDGQDEPRRRTARCQCREEDDIASAAVDLDREDAHERDEQRERDREVVRLATVRVPPEEAETHPEKRPEQHEVAEIPQVDDVGGQPTDQRQLDEQHEPARQHETSAHVHPGSIGRHMFRREGCAVL